MVFKISRSYKFTSWNVVAVCFAAIATLANSSVAGAQTASQRKALEDWALSAAMVEHCRQSEVDYVVLARLMERHGISPQDLDIDGRFDILPRMLFLKSREIIGRNSQGRACQMAIYAYGPRGTKVKGLVRTR